MGFFFNEARGQAGSAPKRGTTGPKRAPTPIPIAAMNRAGCTACPINADPQAQKTLEHPKMDPSGHRSPDVFVLWGPANDHMDKSGDPGDTDHGREVSSKLRRAGLTMAHHTTQRCAWGTSGGVDTMRALECCRGYVADAIAAARPLVVLTVGDAPLSWAAPGVSGGAMAHRGSWFPVTIGGHVCWLVPLSEPRYVDRRNRNRKSEHELVLELDVAAVADFVQADNPWRPKVPTLVPPEDYAKGIIQITGNEPGDFQRLEDELHRMHRLPLVGVDYETSRLRPYYRDSAIATAAVGTFDRTVAFAIMHPEGWGTEARQRKALGLLGEFLLESGPKVAHNLAFELEWSGATWGEQVLRRTEWRDTMLMAHTLDERKGTKGLGTQTRLAFGFDVKAQSTVDTKRIMEEPLSKVLPYNGMDTKWTHRLDGLLTPQIEANPDYAWEYERKLRLAPTLVLSQLKGIAWDVEHLAKLHGELGDKLAQAERQLARCPEVVSFERTTRRKFDPAKPAEVMVLLGDICERSEVRQTLRDGTVRESTDEDVLGTIPSNEVPSVPLILQHRQISKLRTSYTGDEKRVAFVCDDGRAHTQYSSTTAVTGRLASEDPNLQNIPVRTPEGRRVRGAFFAQLGEWIVPVDYGQIEARVIAMCSEDKALVRALWTNYDIHGHWATRFMEEDPGIYDRTASLHSIDRDDIKKLHKAFRGDIKNGWVFPQFFGSSVDSCAGNLHVDVGVAEKLAREFWDEFPGVQRWQQKLLDRYARNLYVETLTGRRRRGAMTKNEIINMPVQGTAGDIVGEAYCALSEQAYLQDDPELQPNLQIHDDLTFVLTDASLETKLPGIVRTMCQHRFDFINVPIVVEVKVGARWDDLEELGVYRSNELFNLRSPV